MDIVSHALIGGVLSSSAKFSERSAFTIVLFSILPDLPQVFVYPFLGYIKKRFLWIPRNSDWKGFRALYPRWYLFLDIPHSIFFALLIILPIVLAFNLPKMAFIAYLLHIFVDLPTHTEEWAVKPFFPLKYKFKGFTDAWAWPLSKMATSWVILSLSIIFLKFFR